jgi:hypothetical protein
MRLSPRSQISGASRRRLTLARWLAHQRHRARSGPGSACENRRQPHRFSACLGSMVSVRPRGARSLVENGRTEDLRPLAESEHPGAGIQRPRCPCSAGCRTSLCRSACSPGNHRSADAHHSSLEWTALGAGRDASQFALSRRANPRRAPELRTDRVQALFCPCSSVADLRFARPS